MKNRNLVYSTDQGRLCPDCEHPTSDCQCQKEQVIGNGKVLIALETKGRKGKGVTVINGLPITEEALKALGKKLKTQCGTGGAVKDGQIEIQGDQRQKIKELLEKEGYSSKFTGG
ncbi:stress response translation initiation inhibitor YciH [Marinomonas sp. M1K-6]|uniref:Stress response translation initiation inhibitor YciH n=1 Tax=Marinomonas profundi TaxID=2726122 RepID=A0A847R656_9GAMM|nr:stress response translation initiation inhibitor YciH [Marinomonas profundi]NLQ16374.1 stress response translation initiation inhibitor YciH [Marinomonas profundi]UDV03052.1 stress response translation initiation inhibitor YciH [Marinomonas profundi]